MNTQVDRVVEAAKLLSRDELRAAAKRLLAMLEELEEQERQAGKTEEEELKKIPFNEGMALYHQVKQRHSDLFRELADL